MKTIGVLLAGGKSSRMGKDKALLTIEHSSMLTRSYQMLNQTSVSEVVISRNDGESGHFADIYPGKGPLSGIHSVAMRFVNADLLIMPIDLPLMNSETLQSLLDCGTSTGKNTRFGEHSLPLFLRNNDLTRQLLDYSLRCTNCYSVDRFCMHFPLNKINMIRQSPLFNANTPAQWRFIAQQFNSRSNLELVEESHGTF